MLDGGVDVGLGAPLVENLAGEDPDAVDAFRRVAASDTRDAFAIVADGGDDAGNMGAVPLRRDDGRGVIVEIPAAAAVVEAGNEILG